MWDDAWHLVLGAECPGCGRPGRSVCLACRAALALDPVRFRVGEVPGIAAREYEGVARRVLVAWKDGRRHLDPTLGTLLALAVAALLTDDPPLDPAHAVLLVPVPTTRRSRRERGTDLMAGAARDASRALRSVGWRATVVTPLELVRDPVDQAGLDADARRANVAGSMRARAPDRSRGPATIVLVDDVVTTGSTARESVRALDRAGWTVHGVASIVAVP